MPVQTILLIDYDPVTVEYARNSLMEAGFAVEVAEDGVSGLECFERIQPDLVVVEAMIPKKHGFEVCREIKGSCHDAQAVPVVITTSSFSGRQHRNEAIGTYGCDEYLEKPIGKNRLVSICRGLLDGPAADIEDPAASEPLPDLDEMNEDQLTAELDRLVPDVDGEEPSEPLAESHAPVEAEPLQPEDGAQAAGGPTAAALARLSGLTEEEIVSRLETVLSKSAARRDEAEPQIPDEQPAVELHDLDEADDETPVEPEPARETRIPERAVAARVEESPTPSTAVKPTNVQTAPPARRPVLLWAGIAAGVLILVAAGWFGLAWMGNGAPEDGAAASSGRAAFTPTREPTPRAAVPSPVGSGEPTGWRPEGAGPSTSDAVDVAALGPPPTSTRLAIPPDDRPGRSEKTAVESKVTQPPVPKPRAERPRSRPQPTTTIPEAEPAVQDAVEAPIEIRAGSVTSETVVVEQTPPDGGASGAVTESPDVDPALVQDEPANVFAIDPLNIMSPDLAARSREAKQEPAIPEPPKVAAGSLVPVEEVDRPPVIVTRTQPNYHPFARRLRQQGTVELRLLIDHEGRVAEVELVRGIPTSRLNDEALRAARSWTYEPAMKDGVPVQVWIPARVDFRL